MSMFENDQYRWRDTYFVLFDSAKRPKLKTLLAKLAAVNTRFMMNNPAADSNGYAESLTLLSPEDYAALDISYLSGGEVRDQVQELLKELETPDCRKEERDRLEQIRKFDGRFDVLHFEQLSDATADDMEEMFDPSSLLIVLDALVELTGGVAVDPQAGAML